jgi:hypothetical protein
MTARMPDEPHGTALTKQQADYVIRTIAAETSGKSPEETQAIASVILNRINSGRYGASPEAVLFAKRQFEPWMNPAGKNYPMNISPKSQRYSDARDALEAAMAGEDITGGATNFWGPKSQYSLGRDTPDWAVKMPDYTDIGATRFHRPNREEGGEVEGYGDGGIIKKALQAVGGAFKPTETGWVFKDVKKPNLTPAQNRAISHAIDAGRYLETELPIRSMYATQPHVNADFATPVSSNRGNLPVVQRIGDEFYVRDGHHRLTKLATEGAETAKVNLVDPWEKTPTEMPLLDWKPKTPEQVASELALAQRQKQENDALYNDLMSLGFDDIEPQGRAHGGLVDDALHVVREHHADGEAVGPTMQQRLRETIASIDPERSREQPVMDPATMGEAWNRARQNYQNFPVQEGEAVARPLELGARDVIGGAIAGGAREPGAQFRRGAADLLVGSTGLPDSGTLGFGVADAPMITGIPLTLADMARDVGQGDYASTAMGAALPAAFYARGPLGAAGRRAVEIAREYAKPAAATAAGVAANVVTPEDAEAAKLPKLPGTFKHPISGTKLVTPIEEMRPVFGAPTEAITPRRPMDWAATEGGVYMPATWDRSRGDRAILEEINGQKLTNPQRMEGGPLYMNWGDVQPEKQVAASGQSIVDRMIETSAEAKKLAGDKDVYLANVLMGLEGADFSHMVANPLVDLARQRGFSKSEAALVDDAIRKSIIQNLPSKAPMDKKVAYASAWPGIMHPDLDQLMWKMGGGYRSAIAKAMDTAAMKTLGVPDVASIRHAATQPELLNSPNLSTGFSVAKVDPGAPSVSSGHTTYPVGMKGLGYEGGSQVDIPFNLFWRDFMKTRQPGESMAHTQRAFTMQMPVQRADPQWVDTISNFERNALRGAIPLE